MSKLLTMTPAQFCAATDACADGRKWALTQPTMADVWDNCLRPDWLLWIAGKLGQLPDNRTLRLFAVWCARNTPLGDGRTTGDLLTNPRSLTALKVAERYADLRATEEQLNAAVAAAQDAAVAAAWGATREEQEAAVAAAWATRDAAWDAAVATREAARAAAQAVRDAARDAAWTAQSNHLRTLVPNPFRKEAQP